MPKDAKPTQPEKLVAKSYIENFHHHVINLTDTSAGYQNLLIELKHRHPGEGDAMKLEDNENQALLESAQNLRFFVQQVYISYRSISENLEKERRSQEQEEKIETLYKRMKDDFIIDPTVIEEYVILFNHILVSQVIRRLLQNAQDIIEGVYGDQS